MRTPLLSALLFLHVLFAAAWLGAALWMPGDVRRTLARGRPWVDALAARAAPALGLDLGAGVGTIVTGLAVWGVEGFGHRTGIELGLAASLARVILTVVAIRPAWAAVQAAVAGTGDLVAADGPARRLGMLAGIAHTLWLVALAGMIFG
ncbi:hypothetical protein [Anaeromyxobacter oryzae]|uniref:Copper resistance protein D domain-containing protein n=1 Tax=Anaeromyxobacter oryzae TaxID=2918170 RepID=A0ABM7WWJ7_9BACT|nr:hypothetical protein [Anaeromyxobacter oryzae]BDG03868.1 hypothetical protein AMOR_28640 [Anaeromyxobacter oryzae]